MVFSVFKFVVMYIRFVLMIIQWRQILIGLDGMVKERKKSEVLMKNDTDLYLEI